LIWRDAFTAADPVFLADAMPSSDSGDFQFALKMDSIPEVTWQKPGDFYKTMAGIPLYQVCKINLPKQRLVRLIRQDFVHNPAYHRLKA
jgi:hypothetical protein